MPKPIKDAFKQEISLNDKVIYSIRSGAGTIYVVGRVVEFHPHSNEPHKQYSPPDRVGVEVERSVPKQRFTKNPIVYASNVIVIKNLKG